MPIILSNTNPTVRQCKSSRRRKSVAPIADAVDINEIKSAHNKIVADIDDAYAEKLDKLAAAAETRDEIVEQLKSNHESMKLSYEKKMAAYEQKIKDYESLRLLHARPKLIRQNASMKSNLPTWR